MKKINKFKVLKVMYFFMVAFTIPHAFFFADTQEQFALDMFLAFLSSLAILVIDREESKEKEQF